MMEQVNELCDTSDFGDIYGFMDTFTPDSDAGSDAPGTTETFTRHASRTGSACFGYPSASGRPMGRSFSARKKSTYLRDPSEDKDHPPPSRRSVSGIIPSLSSFSKNPGERVSVLIVDDSSANQLALKRLVRTIGKKILDTPPVVVCVADGAQAVESCLNSKHMIVLMDIHMPVMGGVQATREIRKRFSSEELPIIAVTADTQTSSLPSEGFNAVLEKPVAAPTMTPILQQYMRPKAESTETGSDGSQGGGNEAADASALLSSASSSNSEVSWATMVNDLAAISVCAAEFATTTT